MTKLKTKEMPVLFIHIEAEHKERLKILAQKRGMQLTTYCRMILLDSMRQNDVDGNK